mgnify:CR=1 FL=1
MRKVILLLPLLLMGCASDGGSAQVGQHGTDSTLSDNKIEGLYLFKVETNMNTITVSGRDSVKVEL